MEMSPIKRVLVFLPCLTLGGAERQGLLVARFLKDRGHDVEVWGFPPLGGSATLIPELQRQGLCYEQLDWWPKIDWRFSQERLSFKYYKGYCAWIKSLRAATASFPRRMFDIVIPFTPNPSIVACLLRKKLGAKICFWNHRGGYDGAGLLYNHFLVRQVLRYSPRFLANSQAGAKFVTDKFGLLPGEVRVIPNAFVPDIEINKTALCSGGPRSGILSLIQVANFFREKDYYTLLRAMQILKREDVVCRLCFCGKFPVASGHQEFLTRVKELNVDDCVIYHGPTSREDVFRLLMDSDVGLLSSKSEGQPNAIMEYMYVGLPVIATKIPGIQELVGDKNEAWLFEVGDADRLAELINRLNSNPALRMELGIRNRERILEHYASDKILPLWAELVEHG